MGAGVGEITRIEARFIELAHCLSVDRSRLGAGRPCFHGSPPKRTLVGFWSARSARCRVLGRLSYLSVAARFVDIV